MTPAATSAPISSTGTYLQATRTSARPAGLAGDLLEVGADPGRVDVVEERARQLRPARLDPGQVAHAAGDALVAAVGEEELRLAEGAEAGRLDLLDPGAGEQAAGDLGEVEHAAVGDPLAEVGEGLEHLGADLVAAGADPGADRGAGRFDRDGAPGDDPGREPAPAAVQHRHAAGPGERDRQAVGGEDERRQAGAADDVPVDLFQRRPRLGERARLLRRRRGRARSALWTCSPIGTSLRVDPDRRREPPPVLDHGRVGVVGEHADVQRVVGSLADPTDPRAEADHPRPSPQARARPAASERRPSRPTPSP